MAKTQTNVELNKHLEEQIQFLKKSAEEFDKGFSGEAKRMAIVLRVLVHDTKKSKSLLGLLGKKDILFYDTAHDYNPNNLATHTGLVGMEYNNGQWRYAAPLSFRKHVKVVFDNWWNKIVIVDLNKNKFTRKDLVDFVANQDGGAHIDPHLNESYHALSRMGSAGWVADGKPLEDVHLASIRQIAYEILESLKD